MTGAGRDDPSGPVVALDSYSARALPEAVAPPMANGEVVFAAPWEGRAFGLVHALCDAGVLSWPQFQRALIATLGKWEARRTADAHFEYYEHWLAALEVLVTEQAIQPELLAREVARLAALPHGHDHGHDHDHAH